MDQVVAVDPLVPQRVEVRRQLWALDLQQSVVADQPVRRGMRALDERMADRTSDLDLDIAKEGIGRASERLTLKPLGHGGALISFGWNPCQAFDRLEGHQVGPGSPVAGLDAADDVGHVGCAHRAAAGLQEGLAGAVVHGAVFRQDIRRKAIGSAPRSCIWREHKPGKGRAVVRGARPVPSFPMHLG